MAVKKEQFKLGNYLFFGVNVAKVLGIIDFPILEKNHQNFYLEMEDSPNRWDSEDNLDAIELTGKWLIDLGFESKEMPITNCIKYSKDIFSIIIDNRFKSIHIGIQRIDDRNFKYVHQLQNIYSDTTGKQLTL